MKDFESLLTTNSPEAQELARALRELVMKTLPDAREKIHPGWGVADYYPGEPQGRGALSIGPQKKYVNLYFMNGVDLPDPTGLLTGSGKRLRHVKIKTAEDLRNPALADLIRAAVSI
ncbi:MAG: DUF1801 domain-containing protein [Bacteroidota bacterium]